MKDEQKLRVSTGALYHVSFPSVTMAVFQTELLCYTAKLERTLCGRYIPLYATEIRELFFCLLWFGVSETGFHCVPLTVLKLAL